MKQSYCQIQFECILSIDEQKKCKYYFIDHSIKNHCIYNMIGTCRHADAICRVVEQYVIDHNLKVK